MVENFNMDMHVGGNAKPPFYVVRLKTDRFNRSFVIMKKTDIVRSAVNGLLDVVGFWTTPADGDGDGSFDVSNREICSIIIPVNNIDYIENLMYRPR